MRVIIDEGQTAEFRAVVYVRAQQLVVAHNIREFGKCVTQSGPSTYQRLLLAVILGQNEAAAEIFRAEPTHGHWIQEMLVVHMSVREATQDISRAAATQSTFVPHDRTLN